MTGEKNFDEVEGVAACLDPRHRVGPKTTWQVAELLGVPVTWGFMQYAYKYVRTEDGLRLYWRWVGRPRHYDVGWMPVDEDDRHQLEISRQWRGDLFALHILYLDGEEPINGN